MIGIHVRDGARPPLRPSPGRRRDRSGGRVALRSATRPNPPMRWAPTTFMRQNAKSAKLRKPRISDAAPDTARPAPRRGAALGGARSSVSARIGEGVALACGRRAAARRADRHQYWRYGWRAGRSESAASRRRRSRHSPASRRDAPVFRHRGSRARPETGVRSIPSRRRWASKDVLRRFRRLQAGNWQPVKTADSRPPSLEPRKRHMSDHRLILEH